MHSILSAVVSQRKILSKTHITRDYLMPLPNTDYKDLRMDFKVTKITPFLLLNSTTTNYWKSFQLWL